MVRKLSSELSLRSDGVPAARRSARGGPPTNTACHWAPLASFLPLSAVAQGSWGAHLALPAPCSLGRGAHGLHHHQRPPPHPRRQLPSAPPAGCHQGVSKQPSPELPQVRAQSSLSPSPSCPPFTCPLAAYPFALPPPTLPEGQLPLPLRDYLLRLLSPVHVTTRLLRLFVCVG